MTDVLLYRWFIPSVGIYWIIGSAGLMTRIEWASVEIPAGCPVCAAPVKFAMQAVHADQLWDLEVMIEYACLCKVSWTEKDGKRVSEQVNFPCPKPTYKALP